MKNISKQVTKEYKNNGQEKLDTSTVDGMAQEAVSEAAGKDVKPPERNGKKKKKDEPAAARIEKPKGKLPLTKKKAQELAAKVLNIINHFAKGTNSISKELGNEKMRWQSGIEFAKLKPDAGDFIYKSFDPLSHFYRTVKSAEKDGEVIHHNTKDYVKKSKNAKKKTSRAKKSKKSKK